MAEWPSVSSSVSSCINIEIDVVDECEERIKRLFDQSLLIFLEEEDNIRPLPAILGNGETVDLFKLFVLVRERGGFDSVSIKGLWESVAEQLGFHCSVSPSLRLIYSKYLDRMEKWAMEKSRSVNWDHRESQKQGCHGGLLHELGDGFKGLLENGNCGKRNRSMLLGCGHVEATGSEFHRSRKRVRESGNGDDNEEKGVSFVVFGDDSVTAAEKDEVEGFNVSSQDLPGMLKWLTSVARSPHHPSIGVIPHWSKWKENTGNNPCWIQVTRAKNALLVQRDNAESRSRNPPLLLQGNHPSMYEDDRKSTGRLRCSVRHPHFSGPGSSSSCNGSLVSHNSCRELITVAPTELQVYSAPNKPEIPRRYVAVGRNFQARVDEWSEYGLVSDTKWLGTRLWSSEKGESLDGTVGKGRPDCCSCDVLVPASVECTRFHIAEKRMELKRELGEVFFHWRFNQMGEEVSLRWTEKEEKRFKEMIVSDPQSFWENAVKCFKGKKREQLVSYYFNVLLINRRRYQNRVTPRQIDSDDEGTFGCVGNIFGGDAVTSFGSDIMICSQNNQCHDF